MEWALQVPQERVKEALALLEATDCCEKPWQLGGRYGPRQRPTNNTTTTAIAILSRDEVLQAAEQSEPMHSLLQDPRVFFTKVPHIPEYVEPRRKIFDDRIHPERQTPPSAPPIRHPRTSFTYIELFAGIGGFGVALRALGGICRLASELDPTCCDIFRRNFPETPLLPGDLRTIRDDLIPPVDLVVGGFPCQPFSRLGRQPGLATPDGRLYLEIVRILKRSQPRAFLLENVPGLANQLPETLECILEALRCDNTYTIAWEILDARGVTATGRKRLFLVGIRTSSTSTAFCFPYVPDLKLRGRDVIDYDTTTDTTLHITPSQLAKLVASPYWRPRQSLAWPDVTTNTLVGHYGKSVSRGHSQLVPTVGGRPRLLSRREGARLMGFPNSFVLVPGSRRIYKYLGNAVCPPLIAFVASSILETVFPNQGWESHGRLTGTLLAYEATKQGVVVGWW